MGDTDLNIRKTVPYDNTIKYNELRLSSVHILKVHCPLQEQGTHTVPSDVSASSTMPCPTPSEETHKCEPSSSHICSNKERRQMSTSVRSNNCFILTPLCCVSVSQKRRTQVAGHVARDVHWASSNHRRIQGWEWALEPKAKGRLVTVCLFPGL